MDAMLNETALKQPEAGRKEMVVRLRGLAARVGQLPVAEAYEVMAWLQPHVDQSLAGSDRILEAIDAKA
jgi:hypothetical protein